MDNHQLTISQLKALEKTCDKRHYNLMYRKGYPEQRAAQAIVKYLEHWQRDNVKDNRQKLIFSNALIEGYND